MGLTLTLTGVRPVYPHFRFVRGSKLYIDMTKVYVGCKPCKRGHNPCYRYKSGNTCVQCVRQVRGTTIDKKCPCGKSVPTGKNGNRKWCDDCLARYSQVKPNWRQTADEGKVLTKRAKDNAIRRWMDTGFTAEMFAECFVIQKGLCGLCSVDLDSLPKFHTHADHEPGSDPKKPRGILCRHCNVRWLGFLEKFERQGDCKITNPQLLEWQTNPPMSKSSFAIELGWKPALTDKEN